MIFLPHSKFDFDDVISGGIIGVCCPIINPPLYNDNSQSCRLASGVCCPIINPPLYNDNSQSCRLASGTIPEIRTFPVNVERLINRYPEAISLYWCKNKTQSVSLGFVREDGAEFAIRFLKSTIFAPNGYGEIISYWKDIVWTEEESPGEDYYILKREYDRQEYAKFVEWLVSQT